MPLTKTVTAFFDARSRTTRKSAKHEINESQKLLKRAQKNLAADVHTEITTHIVKLKDFLKKQDMDSLQHATEHLRKLTERHLADFRKAPWRESFESIGLAILVALSLRSFVVEAFKIPSGSMIPTLAVGDQIFVNKFIYGMRIPFTSIRLIDFSIPKRGDVIVFICPVPPNEDFIKRVIGLPGDEIRVVSGVVYLNGRAVPRELIAEKNYYDKNDRGGWYTFTANTFKEEADSDPHTVIEDTQRRFGPPDFGPTIVPAGHVFVMGDNRDHSYDSRAWGPVPLTNILGKSLFVWWSWGEHGLNWRRIGHWID